jgi:hypothetical protein
LKQSYHLPPKPTAAPVFLRGYSTRRHLAYRRRILSRVSFLIFRVSLVCRRCHDFLSDEDPKFTTISKNLLDHSSTANFLRLSVLFQQTAILESVIRYDTMKPIERCDDFENAIQLVFQTLDDFLQCKQASRFDVDWRARGQSLTHLTTVLRFHK